MRKEPAYMKKTKLILLLLCFCMVLPVLASCADNGGKDDEGDWGQYEYDDLTRETAADLVYTLNPDGYSLKGEKINIIYPGHIEEVVIGDGETNDIVYTKIYERNLRVEDRLNCDLVFLHSGTTYWEDYTAVLAKIFNTRDSTYDIVTSSNNCVIQNKLYTNFHDLNESMYIDIEERWWYTDAIMELSADDYHYRFLYGDILIGSLSNAGAIYYNKDLYAQYLRPGSDKDELYEVVLNGDWTFEYLYTLTKDAHFYEGDELREIHGFSLFRHAEPIHYFAAGCDVEYYSRDSRGFPKITINNQRSIDFTNKLYNFIYNNEGAWLFYPNMVGQEVGHESDFANNKVMFSFGTLSACLSPIMRAMQSDFGILPYPKWDKEQDEYISFMANGSTLVAIPNTVSYNRAMDTVSAVIEAMASEAYRSVSLAFYESALQTAYVRDDYATQMIDIIAGNHKTVKSTLKTNFLYEYGSSCGGIGSIFSSIMSEGKTGNPKFNSKYESLIGAAEAGLDALILEFAKKD